MGGWQTAAWRPWVVLLFTSAALLLQSGLAEAQPRSEVSLHYEMDPALSDCPSRAEFRRDVMRQLGHDPFRSDAPRRLIARTSLNASGMRGSVLWLDPDGGPQGERQFVAEHRDCRELVRSMAFAVVVQLQLLTTPAPEPEQEPEATSEPPPPADIPPQPRETRTVRLIESSDDARNRAWEVQLGAGPSLAFGLAPRPSAVGRLFTAVGYRDFSLELGALGSLPSTWRVADGSGFESFALLARIAPCLQHEPIRGCAVVHVGQLRVEGVGVGLPRSPSGLVGQAGLSLAASQTIGSVVASLRLDALAALTRWKVEVNDSERWEMPSASFLIGVDISVPLWRSQRP